MEKMYTNCSPQNEYVRSLGQYPSIRNSGVIYAVDRHHNRYIIGRIDNEIFDEQNFQYVFTPQWNVIDALPTVIFQGIPGLDMSLHLERYYRVNMTPVFISERTPSQGREDLWELLASVGLDYYDRFEWLLRTKMRCGTDNLIVERLNTTGRVFAFDVTGADNLPDDLQPADCVSITDLQSVGQSEREFRKRLIQILRSGATIKLETENRNLSKQECGTMLRLLLIQQALDEKQYGLKQAAGVEKAKSAGKYTGRKKISVDEKLLQEVANEFRCHKVSEEEAMNRLGIKSRSTFYRRLREI